VALVSLGFQLPHVVVESEGSKLHKLAYGAAYVVVVVGAGTEIAVRLVELWV
jgi:hypothetical protein